MANITRPSIAEVDALKDGEFLPAPHDSVYVRASVVDEVHVKFVCPFCWTEYKENGEPTARAKREVHLHGSGGDHSCRFAGRREPHCGSEGNPARIGFYIYVTPSTKGSRR